MAWGAEAHAIDFMLNPDPLQIGARMLAQHPAMVVFADLLFTECMETYAGLRRWPIATRGQVRPAESGTGLPI